MGKYEDQLRQITSEGQWHVPELNALKTALDNLNVSLQKLRLSDGWSGSAADAASQKFLEMQKTHAKVQLAVEHVERVVGAANTHLDTAASGLESLPSGAAPGWLHDAINEAKDAAQEAIKPWPDGPEFVVDTALDDVAGWLTGNREQQAKKVLTELHESLVAEAARLDDPYADLVSVAKSGDQDLLIDGSTDVTSPSTGGGGGGKSPSSSYPKTPVLTPNPGSGWKDPGSGNDNGGGNDGGGGGGDDGGSDNGGGGDDNNGSEPGINPGFNPGVAAGLAGGAVAAGAVGFKLGTGGFGAAGYGGGLSGGMGGGLSGGLAGGAGSAGTGTGAGAGSGMLGGAGAGGQGAAGAKGGGQGMLGGQQGAAGKKDSKNRRSRLGGPIAPHLEDDEEFVPQSDAALAGGREDDDVA